MAARNEPAQAIRYESHLFPAFAILAVLLLLEILPGRLQIMPVWFFYLAAAVVLTPMVAVAVAPAKAPLMRIERATVFLTVIVATAINAVALGQLIVAITVRPDSIGGIPLLSSSIGIWVTNVMAFSLLYWQVDRGGPYVRTNNGQLKPDWLFPQAEAPEAVPPDWRPFFLDYLFLGFCTATAFSPTDALPLTRRAKMLMMIESAISLVTIVIVAARAINILR
jgi:hypothetical protein